MDSWKPTNIQRFQHSNIDKRDINEIKGLCRQVDTIQKRPLWVVAIRESSVFTQTESQQSEWRPRLENNILDQITLYAFYYIRTISMFLLILEIVQAVMSILGFVGNAITYFLLLKHQVPDMTPIVRHLLRYGIF